MGEQNHFSYYRHPISRLTPYSTISLEEACDYVRSGRLRRAVTQIRESGAASERRAIKSGELDFVTFSGVFSRRRSEEIEIHSGLLCLDYDHIGDRAAVRAKKIELASDAETGIRMIFVSPSGDGLKVVVRIGGEQRGRWDELQRWHKSEYARVASEIERRHGLHSDKTSDMARACYLSWDPEAYLASEPRIEQKIRRQNARAAECERSSRDKVEHALRRLEEMRIDVTREYNDWVRLGFGLANEFGEGGREYYHRASRFYPRYRREETEAKYDECMYKGNGQVKLGTVLWLMKK